ncbi:MAG: hypothetical protein ACXWXK_09995, partial [Actinomycetota bacterium]
MRFSPALALIALLATLALPAAAAASATEQRIAPGVRAGGVELSGRTIEEAAGLLDATLGPPLARPVSVHVAGRVFRLTATEAKVRLDALRTAKRAYYAGRDNPPAPADPSAGGVAPGLDVPLALTHATKVVRAFAERITGAVYLAPADAKVRITVRHIFRRRARYGRALDAAALAATIDQT